MRLIKRILSAVALCLLSAFYFLFGGSKKQLVKRWVSAACVFSILISAVSPLFIGVPLPIITTAAASAESVSNDSSDYRNLSFELYPNEDETDKTVILNGMMPKDASAEAVDVTDAYSDLDSFNTNDEAVLSTENQGASVLAAYNITITDGENEYQPNESRPIHVEITDPQISTDNVTELWHIKDNGKREQIDNFKVEEGKISFYATGFSVYAIVTAPEPFVSSDLEPITSIEDLFDSRANSGIYLFYTNAYKANIFFSNVLISSNCLEEVTDVSLAALWFFEKEGDYYKIFTIKNGEKKYIHTKTAGANNIELSNTADLFEISRALTEDTFYFKKKDESRYLQHSNSGGGIRYYTNNKDAVNSSIKLCFADSMFPPEDYYQLDGKTYGLMNYINGTSGTAFMADEENNTLTMLTLVVRTDTRSRELYVAEDSDITMWTFHFLYQDKYSLSTEINGVTKYLNIGDTLTLVDEPQATEVRVTTDNDGKINLSSNGKSVTLGDNGYGTNTLSTNDLNQWHRLVKLSGLSEDDYVTYSSEKVSVSEVDDGSSVIVYTRIWNDDLKSYEFYALDYDGTLYPCYERGDDIMWVGSQIDTLLWDFTEYHYDDGSPNYYYELYNPYSKKYIAPQIKDGQTLSNTKIGINLPGRRDGEYYTDILAWDDYFYTYAGIKSNLENNRIESSSRSDAETFYFAKVNSLVPTLTEVDTIDNSQFGITMKLIDFPVQPNVDTEEYYQNDFLGTGTTSLPIATKNLLSTNLSENGYPETVRTGKSLSELFAGSKEANHLFIQSIYDDSGYFEFDSCQNFATLIQEDGSVGENFTVYKELGTTDKETKTTLMHGQFFPYNTITAGDSQQLIPKTFTVRWLFRATALRDFCLRQIRENMKNCTR